MVMLAANGFVTIPQLPTGFSGHPRRRLLRPCVFCILGWCRLLQHLLEYRQFLRDISPRKINFRSPVRIVDNGLIGAYGVYPDGVVSSVKWGVTDSDGRSSPALNDDGYYSFIITWIGQVFCWRRLV